MGDKTENQIRTFLKSSDPLSKDAFEFLLNYREEDLHVDCKETFQSDNEKQWLELSKDIMAFANTFGGYIIIGVRDKTYDLIGINEKLTLTLEDTNQIIQKINRHIEPKISFIRSKKYVRNTKSFIVIYIPQSNNETHFFKNDGVFSYPGKKDKIHAFRKGTFYVRRSATNHLGDAQDFHEIVNRRIEYDRESLMAKVARVIEAPKESEVFILSQDPGAEKHKKFIIDDAPDAIPVKGMSFTVAPTSLIEHVSAWIALHGANKKSIPPRSILWDWYENRATLLLNYSQKIALAKFCLISEVPAFFWLQICKSSDIREMLFGAVKLDLDIPEISNILRTSAFLCKAAYNQLLKKIKGYHKRLNKELMIYPKAGPQSLFYPAQINSRRGRPNTIPENEFKIKLVEELNRIATDVRVCKKKQPGVLDRRTAIAIDCYLYGPEEIF